MAIRKLKSWDNYRAFIGSAESFAIAQNDYLQGKGSAADFMHEHYRVYLDAHAMDGIEVIRAKMNRDLVASCALHGLRIDYQEIKDWGTKYTTRKI